MTLKEQVFAQSLLLAGELTEQQTNLLNMLCKASTASLESRLRDGLTAEDCKADFIAAASLLALSALSDVTNEEHTEQVTVADFTVRTSKPGSNAAANCLRAQAELLMMPYLETPLLFMGV